eukprot:1178803-Prorocentrum_minimum.AAC.2
MKEAAGGGGLKQEEIQLCSDVQKAPCGKSNACKHRGWAASAARGGCSEGRPIPRRSSRASAPPLPPPVESRCNHQERAQQLRDEPTHQI